MLKECHKYWKNPQDHNIPENYLLPRADKRTKFLIKKINQYAQKKDKIMEIGCNAGRNLNGIYKAGFKNITGVDINPKAIRLMKKVFPMKVKAYVGAIENIIESFKDKEFDIVFTMSTLEHIPTESEWIFKEMVRITKKYIITIEDEYYKTGRHFPRNYKNVFEPLGMEQIESLIVDDVFAEQNQPTFYSRVFKCQTKKKLKKI